MLVLDTVSYRYAGAAGDAVTKISLDLRDQEVVGLVGANESGKSTVCLVASGLAPRAIGGVLGGRVLIDGADVAGRPIHELVGTVGICFQNPETQLSGVTETVFEEVAFGPANLGIDRDELVRRTGEALETLGIQGLARRDPRRLSGGQMQLVALAGLLALQPRYLVLDEPTAQLDPAGTRLVGEALQALAQRGSAILIAEHKTDLLAGLCGRIAVLQRGELAMLGGAQEVLADDRLEGLGIAAPVQGRLQRRIDALGLAATSIAPEPGR